MFFTPHTKLVIDDVYQLGEIRIYLLLMFLDIVILVYILFVENIYQALKFIIIK